MPSPRRPSGRQGAKPTPMRQKPVDVGQSVGPFDTNSVREKVRRWQQQVGGVIPAYDVGPESDDNKEDDQCESKLESSQDPARMRASRSRNGNRNNESRKRSSSTPMKRVISDEHWRKNRSPPRTPPAKVPPRKRAEGFTKHDQITSPRRDK